MIAVTINLPTELAARVRECVAEDGLDSVEEFILALIRDEVESADSLRRWSQDPEVERLVVDGLHSGDAGPMLAADWERQRRPYVGNNCCVDPQPSSTD